MNKTREERDSFGKINVPANHYWGAQTERSLLHFSIGRDKIPIEMIRAMAIIKKAAAIVNEELEVLSSQKSKWIQQAATEIIDGKLDNEFPLHVWMTGSGTQSNMNVNEVISNRAIELNKGKMGDKSIHPNNDVNMSQSSNDVFPSAMCIATALMIKNTLIPAVTKMQKELEVKATLWKDIVKIGRTHMQDAVPMTLGQEFSGYESMLTDNICRLEWVLNDVYKLTLGGTAVGTGINAHKDFAVKTAAEISKLTSLPFITAPNKFAAQGAHDALVMVSGALRTLAGSLFKIANDIRLLSCGPRAGFYELLIPQNEPGSSIMPGKVNPTQCEAMAMVAAQVMGYDVSVGIAGSGGYLEMNVYKPLMIFNITQSIVSMADSCIGFTEHLLKGMRPNKKKIDEYVHHSLMLVTALSPVIGYDKASELAHYADHNDCSLEEANQALQFLNQEDFIKFTDPTKMLSPN